MVKIVAVCACAMGLAHTFIAAEAIEQTAIDLGYEVKVETQGADGITNKLSINEINSADIIIHATSVIIEEMNRFSGKEVYEVDLHELVIETENTMQSIIDDWNS